MTQMAVAAANPAQRKFSIGPREGTPGGGGGWIGSPWGRDGGRHGTLTRKKTLTFLDAANSKEPCGAFVPSLNLSNPWERSKPTYIKPPWLHICVEIFQIAKGDLNLGAENQTFGSKSKVSEN